MVFAYAFFEGCLTGGRQGLIEAQRYPKDYDGIISGAPVYDQRVANSMVAAGRAFDAPESKLSPPQIVLVNAAALTACDVIDGVRDGIVADPAACTWDPGALLCGKSSSDDNCLSEAQVAAVREAYATLRSPDGRIAVFGIARGSERSAFPLFIDWGAQLPNRVGMQNLREAQFGNANFNFAGWDVVRDFATVRSTPYAKMLDATNPDLSPFIRNGGKLLLWHGLYDQLPRAPSTVEYFENAKRVTLANLQEKSGRSPSFSSSARLFLIPGLAHCMGGPGTNDFDMLAALETWVEKGAAPDEIAAYRREAVGQGYPDFSKKPPPVFSRPLCSYPAQARYLGNGNPNDAASFRCK